MISLPASFIVVSMDFFLRNAKHGCNQSVFGINVKEINEPASLETLGHYVEATITIWTLFTVYTSGKRVHAIIIYGNLFMSLYTSKLFVDTYNKLPRLL